MAEKNLDFDTVIDRRHTGSLKYDFAAKRGMPEDVLPLWVADMDFQTSSYVQEALQKQVEHGIWGYSEPLEAYFDSTHGWLLRHHGWDVQEKWLVKTPGVVFALAMAVKAFTEPGDGVLIQSPVYYPFSEVIRDNGRRIISSDLRYDADAGYYMDFEDMETKIVKEKIKLFFLCSPHNPVGRVWTKEELTRVGDLCARHGVLVVSDEIHEDFVFQGKHQVFANISKEYEDFTITCTSPSKTFNLAGLQVSNVWIPNDRLRRLFCREMDAAGYSQLNLMGLVACEAAYAKGETWYQAVHAYIRENIAFVKSYVEEYLPGIKMAKHEGTYLVWLDFRGLGLETEQLEDFIINRAKLWLDSGKIFGASGEGFQRINTACPRKTLQQALTQLKKAL